MGTPEDDTDIIHVAAAYLGHALTSTVPISKTDIAVLDRITRISTPWDPTSFFGELARQGEPATPGIWSFYLRSYARYWGELAFQDHASTLPLFRDACRDDLADHTDPFLDAVAEAFAALSMLAYEDTADAREEARAAFHHISACSQALGIDDLAYDFAALALDLGSKADPGYENTARFALALAMGAGKSHQVAMCSVVLAEIVAIGAQADNSRRLEAFEACEIALERIMQSDPPYSGLAAERLAAVINAHSFLDRFLLPLMLYLPDMDNDRLRHELQAEHWPQRVERLPKKEWLARLRARLTAEIWEGEIEKARFALESPSPQEALYADWIDWTIDHPAYRRAVPHLRSFLREQNFKQNFLELTHEITHVMSLLGGFGMALACVRAAAFRIEATLSSILTNDANALTQQLLEETLLPIPRGHVPVLFRAEQGLELTLKARVLQDTWAAWFEGIAIFGELSADPAMDPDGIGPVNGCLRNLVDFMPNEEQRMSEEACALAFDAYHADFEKQCSAAIADLAPVRLRHYLDHEKVPYFSGYLAVRSVVARWRHSTGLRISSTAAFNLLLHATRYAIHDGLPDLALPSRTFAAEARRKMADWVRALAYVDPAEIRAFLEPRPRNSQGTTFYWHDMHVQPFDGDMSAFHEREQGLFRKYTQAALMTLARPEDVDRLDDADPIVRMLASACAEGVRENLDGPEGRKTIDAQIGIASYLLRMNSLLPVGRSQCKYFVNAPPDGQHGYLGVTIRTTERHMETGTLSMNQIWLPISHDDATNIASTFASTGSPRMEAVRLIDLSGHVLDSPHLEWPHIISLRYGDWHHLYGPNLAVQAQLDDDPAQRNKATKLISDRLYPTGIIAAEMKTVARGECGAKRTYQSTDPAQPWYWNGVDVTAWTRYVHDLGHTVLDGSHRADAQRAIGLDLLRALNIDTRLIEALRAGNFSDMTSAIGRRGSIIDTFLHTARCPVTDDRTTALAEYLTSAELPFFVHGPLGWDVQPAL